MDEQASESERPRPRWRRALTIGAQVCLGLGLGLVLTELAFAARDQRAFPHVNFYVPDAELGARLQPGASMAFRLGDNPLTHIHVNSQGYRGPEWPAPGADEILIVGDSQVFGLGVDDDQTFSAKLARLLDRTVLNAGVPTYGPPEYRSVAAELLDQRPITQLVVVINFLNDPFELARPNRERHAIWDGWAVQIETAPAPDQLVWYPGRKWLMSRSHAVYALRRWWHSRDQAWFDRVDRGLPSEGDWQDLLVESETNHASLRSAELDRIAKITDAEQRRAALQAALDRLDTQLDTAQEQDALEQDRRFDDDDIIEAKPGGIVLDRYSEAARKIEVTAEMYRAALERRRERRRAAAEAEAERKQLEAERERLATQLDAPLPDLPPQPDVPLSVFEPYFADIAALCEAHDVEPIIVLLPFDLQVSPEQWHKYGVEDGPDMTPTLALLDDAHASADKLGIRVLDVTADLRAAGPAAFLDGDIHMTPRGHAAVADALASLLREQPEPTKPAAKQSRSK